MYICIYYIISVRSHYHYLLSFLYHHHHGNNNNNNNNNNINILYTYLQLNKILQLATPQRVCYLIRLSKMAAVPNALKDFLDNKRYICYVHILLQLNKFSNNTLHHLIKDYHIVCTYMFHSIVHMFTSVCVHYVCTYVLWITYTYTYTQYIRIYNTLHHLIKDYHIVCTCSIL